MFPVHHQQRLQIHKPYFIPFKDRFIFRRDSSIHYDFLLRCSCFWWSRYRCVMVVQTSWCRLMFTVVVFRPGVCAGTSSGEKFKVSNEFPDETLNFIKIHPLMDEAVPSIANRPWFLKTMVRWVKHLQINYALRLVMQIWINWERAARFHGWIESFASESDMSDSLRFMDVFQFFRIIISAPVWRKANTGICFPIMNWIMGGIYVCSLWNDVWFQPDKFLFIWVCVNLPQ